ncbi:MAG: beta-galactosidase, partial [Thalassolituus oleivorans]|nr:beta-galactosidase [Thalassolituus oleivorans]
MSAFRFFSVLMSYTFAFLCLIAVSGCQNVLGEGSDLKHEKTQNAAVTRDSSAAVNRPSGIFISGGQYQEEPLLAKPFVDGALIRVRWHELEPSEGQFDWSYLDSEIAKVTKLGKVYTLAVVGGPSTPSWVFAKGAQGYSFTLNNPYASKARPVDNKLPLPWDAIYLKAWHRLIAELGKRYSSDPNLLLVHITLSSQNGFEMHLPYSRGPRDPNQLPSW